VSALLQYKEISSRPAGGSRAGLSAYYRLLCRLWTLFMFLGFSEAEVIVNFYSGEKEKTANIILVYNFSFAPIA